MRRSVIALGLALTGTTVLFLAYTAGAQTGSITFDPPTVVAGGGKLFINGSCEPNSSGFLISQAFAAQPSVTEFAGVPALQITTGSQGTFGIGLTIDPSVKPGAYSVSLRCGGGLAASGTLTVTSSSLAATGSSVAALGTVGAVLLAVGLALAAFGRPKARAR
jgi:hypothetical protein